MYAAGLLENWQPWMYAAGLLELRESLQGETHDGLRLSTC
jgi:hypothetical protein